MHFDRYGFKERNDHLELLFCEGASHIYRLCSVR